MKRPVLLTLAIIFMVASLATLGILIASLTGKINVGGFFRAGFSDIATGELIKEETFDASSLSELNISTQDQKIEIILTDDDFITVSQYDGAVAEPFSTAETSDELRIALGSKFRITVFNAIISRLEIHLPRSYAGDVTAVTSSGGITCDDAVTWSDAAAESRSGSVRIADIACSSLTVSSSSGAIRVGGIASGGAVNLESTSGSIRAEGAVHCDELRVETLSGSVSLADVSSSAGAVITTASGSIRAGDISAQSYSVRPSSGSVRLTMGGMKNLAFEISSNSGSLRTGGYEFMYDASGRRGVYTVGDGSAGTLSVKTTSGAISID
ncbi:MAG: DUF4097 domain-containing protein [Clostridiales bacterium]|nr:DUF4097 domain-containing protein [Clostridiales bacterium]